MMPARALIAISIACAYICLLFDIQNISLIPTPSPGHAHSAAADWWSFGVVLFEFLFGVPPFAADTRDAVFAAILAPAHIDWAALPCAELEVEPAAVDLLKARIR